MKVIVANYRYFIAGGPERYMFKFMDAAESRGIEVIPFSVKNPRNERTPYEKYFAKPRSSELMYADTKKTLSNYWGMLRATLWNYDAEKKLRKLIRDTKADAVYILHEVNHLSPSIIRAAKKENVRVIHRISDFFMFCARYDFLCGEDICEACLNGNYTKAISSRCVKNSKMGTYLRVAAMKLYKKTKVFDEVDTFIATCEFSKNKLIQGGVPQDKIKCIPTFVEYENIEPCYENDGYFLFLGRMAKQKGTKYAVEAMKYLKDTDYVLKITGNLTESEEDQEIAKIIYNYGLEEKIVFTGFKSGKELSDLISRSTCVVCPAIWYENMPNTVIESYAYGKPVVASALGSLEDIVVDKKTGFLFNPKDSYDMAKKLRRFVEETELAESMGRKARTICEDLYGRNRHMDMLIKVLGGIDE